MGLSRTEINLRRLLSKCELLIKSKQKDDERFPQYIESLEGMLKILETTTPRVATEEVVNEYYKRIYNLKFVLGLVTQDDEDLLAQHSGLEDKIIIAERRKLNAREELLGIRQRDVKKTAESNDLDELIDYHQDMQQKIADNMLTLTRNLKEQSELANRIIKKDTEVVGRSTQLTEDNFAKIKSRV